MRARGTLAVFLAAVVLLGGCSGSESDGGKGGAEVEIPDKPAGLEGDDFCAKVTEAMLTEAIGAPYRTYDPILVKDFPAPGTAGYECQWQWSNPDGDVRTLKIDALGFVGALEGSLDASWKGTIDTMSTRGEKVDGLGEGAYSAKLQGLVTLTARQGDWQVTAVASAEGSASPSTVPALSLVVGTVLEAVA